MLRRSTATDRFDPGTIHRETCEDPHVAGTKRPNRLTRFIKDGVTHTPMVTMIFLLILLWLAFDVGGTNTPGA